MPLRSFARLFKQVTGLGFAQYALRSRLARAARELCLSDTPVKNIGLDFGFRHHSHFTRAFLAHYGVPPRRYRAAHAAGL